eukprot:GHUV01044190.1.p1 GENE.GHUV01044190.1~~GHUV01044190.1.p1  ORF type:complete len:157 (-),score=55.94 GHUV01044190.1:479-928(-)
MYPQQPGYTGWHLQQAIHWQQQQHMQQQGQLGEQPQAWQQASRHKQRHRVQQQCARHDCLLGSAGPAAAEVLHSCRVTQSENGITNGIEIFNSCKLGAAGMAGDSAGGGTKPGAARTPAHASSFGMQCHCSLSIQVAAALPLTVYQHAQ